MRKTDKKIENALRRVLTEVCDMALETQEGFMWLTHFVNYHNFPSSLSIVCVFATNEQLTKANRAELRAIIKEKLMSIDIKIKDIHQHISFDSEENCEKENNGKWHERFK
jgi:hypothetical protein